MWKHFSSKASQVASIIAKIPPSNLAISIGTFGILYQALKIHGGIQLKLEESKRQTKEQLEALKSHNKLVSVPYLERVEYLKKRKLDKIGIESIRDEVSQIQKYIKNLEYSRFVLVRGPQGVGKTCAIYTALKDCHGVIRVDSIEPELDEYQILDQVCQEITGLPGTYLENKIKMLELTKMYRAENNKSPLIVLIQASERHQDKKPAALTAAARTLAETYKLTVIIDCPENACPSSLRGRGILLRFEPMSYDMMCKLTEYTEIADKLEKHGDVDIVMAVCAGRPLLLQELYIQIKHSNQSSDTVIRQFVEYHMANARKNIINVIGHPGVEQVNKRLCFIKREVYSCFKKVLEEFQYKSEILLQPNMPDMTEVLREVRDDKLAPATGAMTLQLRMGLRKKATFNEIKEWLSKQDESVKAALMLKKSTNK